MKYMQNQVIEPAILSIDEQNELERCEVVIKQGLETFIEVGQALMIIRDKRLYRSEHGTFEHYCRDKWGVSRIHAHRLVESAEVISNLLPTGNILPDSERQARPLTKVEPELQPVIWNEVVRKNENITAQKVEQAVGKYLDLNDEIKQIKWEEEGAALFQTQETTNQKIADRINTIIPERVEEIKKAHVSHNSGENEWYTPKRFIDSARVVMGGIDLDPASSEIANETVEASNIFTKDDNGLLQKWFGRVWMNPPYAQPLIAQFIDKVCTEEIQQAIVLVNNGTETAWGNQLLSTCSAICFPKSRIRFVAPNGQQGDSPLQGQMICYIGEEVQKFINEFQQYGVCLKKG